MSIGGNKSNQPLKLIEAANVGDQWIVGRALFGLEYLSNSVRVKKIRAKAVNRFGRKCDKTTRRKAARGRLDRVLIGL